jgi:hypothetical protein
MKDLRDLKDFDDRRCRQGRLAPLAEGCVQEEGQAGEEDAAEAASSRWYAPHVPFLLTVHLPILFG